MINYILSDQKDSTLTITLNNPEKHNCIKYEMLDRLDDVLTRAEKNETVRVIVIRGAGSKSFSTGGDLQQFRALKNKGVRDWIQKGNELFTKLEHLHKPTIAVISGYAVGGGLELALACDLRIATPNAVFRMPELSLGWPPGWGGLIRLKQLIGEARSKELIFLGDAINARKAYEFGLVHDIIEQVDLDEKLRTMTEKLSAVRSEMFAFSKAVIHGDSSRGKREMISSDTFATTYAILLKAE